MATMDSFKSKATLDVGGKRSTYYRLGALADAGIGHVDRLPFSLKVLLENLIRFEDGRSVTKDQIQALAGWDPGKPSEREIAFRPARVLLQDFTGVPCVVDLAAMRDALHKMSADQIGRASCRERV